MLAGENGIINNAREASNKTTHSGIYEKMKMEASNYIIEKNTNNTTKSLIEYLIDKEILNEIDGVDGKWQIDVDKLMESKQSLGKGNAEEFKDIYTLEDTSYLGYVINKEFAYGPYVPHPDFSIFPTISSFSRGTSFIVKYYGKNENTVNLGDIVVPSSEDNDLAKLTGYFVNKSPEVWWDDTNDTYTDSEIIHINWVEPYEYIKYNNNYYRLKFSGSNNIVESVEKLNAKMVIKEENSEIKLISPWGITYTEGYGNDFDENVNYYLDNNYYNEVCYVIVFNGKQHFFSPEGNMIDSRENYPFPWDQ